MEWQDLPDEPPSLTEANRCASSGDVSHEAAKMATLEQEAGGTDASNDDAITPLLCPKSEDIVGNGENNKQLESRDDSESSQVNGEVQQEVNEEEDRCEDDPNFATICSFFLKFGHALGISYSIEDLKIMLQDHEHGEFSDV